VRKLLVATLLLLAAACGGDDEAAGPPPPDEPATDTTREAAPDGLREEYIGEADGFYDVPDPLPEGRHGDLIRWQRLDGYDVTGTVWRVMYLSESIAGDAIAVTGLVAAPDGEPPAEGRPVLSWAHGTTGLADRCAPSKEPDGVTLLLAGQFLDRGWVVVGTDYEGLGTPGRHPYIAGVSAGRGTLDIVRAAAQLPGTGAGDTTVIWGHSQGGHAALFASELAPTWTPELDVVGTVAGAPPSDPESLAGELRDGPYQGYLVMAAVGINAAYPEAELSSVLTERAIDLLDVVDEGCTADIFATFNALDADEVAVADPTAIEPWRSILRENQPGTVAVETPLLIIHGEADEQIPVASSQALFERLCGLGQVVERRTYPDLGHAEVVIPSFPDMLIWMEDRVAGTPAGSGCPGG
jgi:fermentation-respiration switch protein FrsA (DUF1100 family)